MKTIHGKTYVKLLSILMIFLFSTNAQASQQKKRVFIVHSYEKNHICGQPQHDGAVKALEEGGWVEEKNLIITTYYMDTKRKNNTSGLIKEQGKIALARVKDFKPDILLTLDDNAFRTVALPLAGEPVKIVFSGMNKQPEEYNKIKYYLKDKKEPGNNITGVYEKLHVKKAIRVLSNMLELQKIRILSDLSPTGKAIAKQVELELES